MRATLMVCFLHQAWRDTLDQAVDMYGKLLDCNRKLVEDRLDDMLKAQRHAVDRIVQRYRRLGAVLLDSDVGDDELRARLLSIVPEEQLREDQSDLASWTRGDRKARSPVRDCENNSGARPVRVLTPSLGTRGGRWWWWWCRSARPARRAPAGRCRGPTGPARC